MPKEKDQRPLRCRYAKAKNVLPPELFRTLQQHFAGLLWVPADTHFYSVRRGLVLALRDQGGSTIEIAKLAGITPRRVRQILAKNLSEYMPTAATPQLVELSEGRYEENHY